VSHTNSGATNVAHGLGATPEYVIAKETDAATSWWVYHKDMTSQTARHMIFDTNAAETTVTDVWGVHTSTNTILGAGASGLATGTYVVYSFVGVEGYSKFGTYEGNASTDGPFIWCGFRPKLVICRNLDASGGNYMWDAARSPYNPVTIDILVETPDVEVDGTQNNPDFLSNGFKLVTSTSDTNGSSTYIFAAFAEFPFGGDGVSQARAR
jgi:hypothetical protein